MTMMDAMLIYGISHLKRKLRSRNQWADFDEAWYEASETQAHYILFKYYPWFDLNIFYSKVIFGNLGFYVVKCDNDGLFRNTCIL